MKRFKLLKEVIVSGRDVFGRKSSIKFSPADLTGWWWRCGEDVVPITSDIAHYNPRRITLKYKRNFLEIYEHIGALRWTGLDGIIIESPVFPPYFGRVFELWEALKFFCVENGRVPWIRLEKDYVEATFDKNGMEKRLVSLKSEERKLTLEIIIEIDGLGARISDFRLPMPLDLIFSAHTLGWPPRLYYLSKIGGKIGWPHHKNIEWSQKNLAAEQLTKKICMHRASDLLGALSLITNDHLVSGAVRSFKGGHRLDMGLIKQIRF